MFKFELKRDSGEPVTDIVSCSEFVGELVTPDKLEIRVQYILSPFNNVLEENVEFC